MRTCSNISSLPVTLIIGRRSASVTLSSQQSFRDATGTRNFRNIHGTFFSVRLPSVLLHSHVSLDGFVQPRLSHFLHPRPLPALIGPTQKAQNFLCCHLVVRSPPAISEFSFLSFFFVPPTRINPMKCLFKKKSFILVLPPPRARSHHLCKWNRTIHGPVSNNVPPDLRDSPCLDRGLQADIGYVINPMRSRLI